jgi:hypothetical protein
MKKKKNNTLEQIIEIAKVPDELVDRDGQLITFGSAEFSNFEKEQLAIRDLKKTADFTPKLRIDSETGEATLIAISLSEMDQEERIKQQVKQKEDRAKKIAELVVKNTAPDNDVQIFVPENTVKNPDRTKDQIPEIINGILHYRTDSELQQVIVQEKVLKKKALLIGDEKFESFGKQSSNFIVNESTAKDVEVKLVYVCHDENDGIKAVQVLNDGSLYNSPIKLNFNEAISNSFQHKRLIEHAIYAEKQPFIVKADQATEYDFKLKERIIKKIKVTEILDFGLKNYDENSLKIWEKPEEDSSTKDD